MSRFGVYGSGPVRMKINGSRLVTWSEENVVKSFENGIDKSENSVDILGKFISPKIINSGLLSVYWYIFTGGKDREP